MMVSCDVPQAYVEMKIFEDGSRRISVRMAQKSSSSSKPNVPNTYKNDFFNPLKSNTVTNTIDLSPGKNIHSFKFNGSDALYFKMSNEPRVANKSENEAVQLTSLSTPSETLSVSNHNKSSENAQGASSSQSTMPVLDTPSTSPTTSDGERTEREHQTVANTNTETSGNLLPAVDPVESITKNLSLMFAWQTFEQIVEKYDTVATTSNNSSQKESRSQAKKTTDSNMATSSNTCATTQNPPEPSEAANQIDASAPSNAKDNASPQPGNSSSKTTADKETSTRRNTPRKRSRSSKSRRSASARGISKKPDSKPAVQLAPTVASYSQENFYGLPNLGLYLVEVQKVWSLLIGCPTFCRRHDDEQVISGLSFTDRTRRLILNFLLCPKCLDSAILWEKSENNYDQISLILYKNRIFMVH
ncbi:unnamed protein product [Caenorhabditis bovis]|uniref:Uncharacterized protein n=1 Tax=Caenorhabditis bovis TaxID=2654633 RepID=A0A8S1F9H8_9PELO|nr:unnamed protein product [Caenorhabditis bovis]